jgi:hypothetical protein
VSGVQDLPPELAEITEQDDWADDPQAWQEFLRRWVRQPLPQADRVVIASGR